jgi:hypothetical protein
LNWAASQLERFCTFPLILKGSVSICTKKCKRTLRERLKLRCVIEKILNLKVVRFSGAAYWIFKNVKHNFHILTSDLIDFDYLKQVQYKLPDWLWLFRSMHHGRIGSRDRIKWKSCCLLVFGHSIFQGLKKGYSSKKRKYPAVKCTT